MSTTIKIGGVAIVVSLVIILFFLLVDKAEAPSTPPTNKEETKEEIQRPDALDRWITKLAFCESSNRPEAINQFDGGSPSYGYLQWKVDSFWRYNNKYKVLPNLEKQEVYNIIKDRETQIELTRKVLLEEYNGRGWRNWWNCARIVGVAELKEIQEYYNKNGSIPK